LRNSVSSYPREYDFTLLRPAARRRLWQPGHTRGEPHFRRLAFPAQAAFVVFAEIRFCAFTLIRPIATATLDRRAAQYRGRPTPAEAVFWIKCSEADFRTVDLLAATEISF
jgi:hypothetical protein